MCSVEIFWATEWLIFCLRPTRNPCSKMMMTSQTHHVIQQNDPREARNCSISYKIGVQATWEKLTSLNFFWELLFCYKKGFNKAQLKLELASLQTLLAYNAFIHWVYPCAWCTQSLEVTCSLAIPFLLSAKFALVNYNTYIELKCSLKTERTGIKQSQKLFDAKKLLVIINFK